jgi:hypothetical protein
VPVVMVSAHIAPNTIVNTTMDHCSFLKTVQHKWNLITGTQGSGTERSKLASPSEPGS